MANIIREETVDFKFIGFNLAAMTFKNQEILKTGLKKTVFRKNHLKKQNISTVFELYFHGNERNIAIQVEANIEQRYWLYTGHFTGNCFFVKLKKQKLFVDNVLNDNFLILWIILTKILILHYLHRPAANMQRREIWQFSYIQIFERKLLCGVIKDNVF